jgi:hypothetical protein
MMIRRLTDRYVAKRPEIVAAFKTKRPEGYEDILSAALEAIREDEYSDPDPLRITTAEWGDYQGTLVFVVACGGNQPSHHWVTKVSYGSCSWCDAFKAIQAIRCYGDEPITDSEACEYWTLGLHLVQHLRPVCPEDDEEVPTEDPRY